MRRSLKRTATLLTTAALIALSAMLSASPGATAAPAAAPPNDAACSAYAKIHRFTTGKPAKPALIACRLKADAARCTARPAAVPAAICEALASAAIANGVRGWAARDDLQELLRRESTWNPNAVNGSSGACGLFQRLPCPWKIENGKVQASAVKQARNGLSYITGRYGTPAVALAFHDANHWY